MIAILYQMNSDYMTLVTRCCLLHDRQWQWCASRWRYTGILKYSNWVKAVRCEWNSTLCREPLHNLVNTVTLINLLKSTGYVMHHHFNIHQLYALPTLYLRVLYLSQNKLRLVPLTA